MFCKTCGNQLAEGITLCDKCGSSEELQIANQQQNQQQPPQAQYQPPQYQQQAHQPPPVYRAPNFEFKTVKCYPSDSVEERYKNFYEDCGWQIMDMDRKQFFDGQDSQGTKHYSTQTHIKMQRDKNHPNYAKIAELSETAERYFGVSKAVPKKRKASFLIFGIITLPIWPLALYLLVKFFKGKSKAKIDEAIEYNADVLSKCNEARRQCKELVNNY